MNKKVIVKIIIVVMLILFVPIPLHLKDGGTVVYRAVLYKLTKYHKLAIDTTVETEAGTITYTLEDAKKAEFVCFENGDITEG